MCTCGRTDDHVVAQSRTFDGALVCRWDNGDITGVMGIYPAGLSKSRLAFRQQKVADLVWPNISLYDWSELPLLIRTARKAVTQTSLDPKEYLRRSMEGEKFRSNGTVLRSV